MTTSTVAHENDRKSHHPETFVEAVAVIEQQGASIIDAFKGGTPDDAHDALHEIGHVIEELPELAMKEKFSAELNEKVNSATEKLMNAFGTLDDSMHGGKGKSLDDVTLEVDWSLKQLKSVPESNR